MTENNNKRIFPRIDAQCPVLHRFNKNSPWKVGKMLNFSANGIKLQCNESRPIGSTVYIHIKPGSKRTIPEIHADGIIKRIDETESGDYIISCQLKNVSPVK